MFDHRVKLFKLMGFQVSLDASWLIIAVLVAWSLARGVFPAFVSGLSPGTYWWMAAAGAAGLFLSIVLHEFGHSIVARSQGIPMTGITLFVFGGVAEMGGEPPSATAEFLMAMAGPITSFILAGVSYGIRKLSDAMGGPIEVTAIFAYLAWINAALAIFNLVPAFPLDGGRVLRSILWAARKNLLWATRAAAAIGTGFACLLMAAGVASFFFGNFITGIWWFVLGMFIRGASRRSLQQVLVRHALLGEPVAKFMDSHPVTVPASTSIKDVVERFVYRYPFRTFPVVDDGHLLGCINLNQLKQVPPSEWEARTAGNLAVPCSNGTTIAPDADAANALSTMSRGQSGRLLVVERDRLVGVVALKDLLNFLTRRMELEGA
ncbi:MAG: site-2 protease family protein [Verrucomicrobia bacterium]|nr:MAG: site-2 protease family protein [Verrucomicrobiota bacterium]